MPIIGSKSLLASSLKKSFDLLYHQFAWTYDFVASIVSLGLWNQWIAAAYTYLDDQPILELGFGTGHLQAFYLEHGTLIFGIDKSRQMADRTHRKLRKAKFEDRLIQGDATKLPFRAHTFKRIIATFPSEYIFEIHTLEEIWRVLDEGGITIILPVAWITKKMLFHRIASYLFKITNEAPPQAAFISGPIEQFKSSLIQIGFTVEIKIIPCKDSQALIISAQKPPQAGSESAI